MIGTTLGHYQIQSQAGAGGMGEVYVALDTKLDRQVALKVLPQDLAQDAERLARFDREAKTVAGLNHPNIVTLFAVENVDGVHFLTMELVEGKTLSELREDGDFSLEQIFDIFTPLADGLHAAHRSGVIHRDLKPANVMVTDDGRVKILDFGLAKLSESSGEDNTRTQVLGSDLTEPGRVFGTVPYMSPEQVQGKDIDARSDIFSTGSILYQMITGERPFTGETPADQISSVLRDQPSSVLELKRGLPRHLGRIVQRCLEKDPNRRYQTALDLRNELEFLKGEFQSGELNAAADEVLLEPAKKRSWNWLGALGILVGILIGRFLISGGGGESAGDDFLLEDFQVATVQIGIERDPRLSPDGTMMVYTVEGRAAHNAIMLQRVGGSRPIQLAHGDETSGPSFSPDGEFIAYRTNADGGGIAIMGATGESSRKMTNWGFDPDWSPDGKRIVYAEHSALDPNSRGLTSGLYILDVETGESEEILEEDAIHPRWSPDGEWIVFWGMSGSKGYRNIYAIRPDGSDHHEVLGGTDFDVFPEWSPDGKFVYFASRRSGTQNLWRVAVDADANAVGDPEPVTVPAVHLGRIDFSQDGSNVIFENQIMKAEVLRADWDEATQSFTNPTSLAGYSLRVVSVAPSPDGEWITIAGSTTQDDIYVLRRDGTDLRRLTNDDARDRGSSFTQDGREIVYYSNRSGKYEVWQMGTDGGNLRARTQLDSGTSIWYPKISTSGNFISGHNEHGMYVTEFAPAGILEFGDSQRAHDGDGAGLVVGSAAWAHHRDELIAYVIEFETFAAMEILHYDAATEEIATYGLDGFRAGGVAWMDADTFLLASSEEIRAVDVKELERGASFAEASKVVLRSSPITEIAYDPNYKSVYWLTRDGEEGLWVGTVATP